MYPFRWQPKDGFGAALGLTEGYNSIVQKFDFRGPTAFGTNTAAVLTGFERNVHCRKNEINY